MNDTNISNNKNQSFPLLQKRMREAEVFYDSNNNPANRNQKGALGIDIQVIYKGKVAVAIDLKTSKKLRGFGMSKALEISKRNGNVPVVEVFLPFL